MVEQVFESATAKVMVLSPMLNVFASNVSVWSVELSDQTYEANTPASSVIEVSAHRAKDPGQFITGKS